MAESEGFWATVELMGHQRALGFVREVTIAGAGFLQIEQPATAAREASVRIVAPAAIYAINPTTEDRVRQYLEPSPARPSLPSAELEVLVVDDEDFDDPDDY